MLLLNFRPATSLILPKTIGMFRGGSPSARTIRGLTKRLFSSKEDSFNPLDYHMPCPVFMSTRPDDINDDSCLTVQIIREQSGLDSEVDKVRSVNIPIPLYTHTYTRTHLHTHTLQLDKEVKSYLRNSGLSKFKKGRGLMLRPGHYAFCAPPPNATAVDPCPTLSGNPLKPLPSFLGEEKTKPCIRPLLCDSLHCRNPPLCFLRRKLLLPCGTYRSSQLRCPLPPPLCWSKAICPTSTS